MDVKEYISSGILESYSLGLTTDQETREVECLASIYPELQNRLVEIDRELIAITERTKRQPHPRVKEQIFKQFDEEVAATPFLDPPTEPTEKDSVEKERRFRLNPLWAAASIVLLAALAYMLFQNSQLNQQIDEQASINQQNQERITALSEENARMNQKTSLLAHAATQHIFLQAPTGEEEGAKAEVYWNAEKQQFLLTNYLPSPPEGKQYQFWAIVNGEPQDMGIIPLEENAELLQAISHQSVDAFAITLEDEGGSPTPSLDQMKAIGKLA